MGEPLKIIGYHICNRVLADSDGDIQDSKGYLSFLLRKSSPETIQVFWHMDWFVAELLRCLDFREWEGRKLLTERQFYTTPWTLSYTPGKVFAIDKGRGKGHPYATFSNMAQYRTPHLEEPPEGKIHEYCIQKAKEAKEIGEQVYQALADIGLHPRALTSPIASYQKEVLSKIDLPTVDDYPDEVGEMAYSCCKRSWLEAFQRGHWEKTWDWDLRSAYGFELSKLPDVRKGTWVRGRKHALADLGFLRGRLTINPDVLYHPFLIKGREDMSFAPTGTWPDCLTKKELSFLTKCNLGKFEIEDSWRWIPEGEVTYPLRDEVLRLHREKEKATGIKKDVIKRILSGIWGKLHEVHQYSDNPMGPLFNPVWASEVETNTRLEVARAAYDNGILPIHVAVDGLITDRELNLGNGRDIGEWELNSTGPALVLGTGVVALKDKKGTGDFSLDYNELTSYMKENPEATEYKMTKLSPMTLTRAIATNRWEKLGSLIETTRSVNFEYEVKRCWPELKNTAREILEDKPVESVPWDISLVKG